MACVQVWAGSIGLDVHSAGQVLRDVRLCGFQPSQKLSFPCTTALHLLSFVDASAIPLHMLAGPSLGVYTRNEATGTWLDSHLLGALGTGDDGDHGSEGEAERLDDDEGRQCDVGMLVGVDGDVRAWQGGPRITELMIYASASRNDKRQTARLPTPPRSSSPHPADPIDNAQRTVLKVYALPLSSELLCNASMPFEPHSPPSEMLAEGQGRFLPAASYETHDLKKRQRLDSLFDDASQQNKRLRRHGGESVVKMMAGFEKPTTKAGKYADVSNKGPTSLRERALARPQGLGPVGGPSARTKTSSLHRVISVGDRDSSSPAPEALNRVEQQNKNALQRVVMAGMRMYGLQQRKKAASSRAASEAPADNRNAADDDEYKMVYHQTYKAAAFALRRHMANLVLGQESMRDVVDRLLTLLCTDPLATQEWPSNPFGSDKPGPNAFDAPSDARTATSSKVATNSDDG